MPGDGGMAWGSEAPFHTSAGGAAPGPRALPKTMPASFDDASVRGFRSGKVVKRGATLAADAAWARNATASAWARGKAPRPPRFPIAKRPSFPPASEAGP